MRFAGLRPPGINTRHCRVCIQTHSSQTLSAGVQTARVQALPGHSNSAPGLDSRRGHSGAVAGKGREARGIRHPGLGDIGGLNFQAKQVEQGCRPAACVPAFSGRIEQGF